MVLVHKKKFKFFLRILCAENFLKKISVRQKKSAENYDQIRYKIAAAAAVVISVKGTPVFSQSENFIG